MSYRVERQPDRLIARHQCKIPLRDTSIVITGSPEARPAERGWTNSVIVCDECWQHWRCDGEWWWPISDRHARRLVKRHAA